jgi:hypothetical protein
MSRRHRHLDVRLTVDEDESIRLCAKRRRLSVAEYTRQALAKQVDADIEEMLGRRGYKSLRSQDSVGRRMQHE